MANDNFGGVLGEALGGLLRDLRIEGRVSLALEGLPIVGRLEIWEDQELNFPIGELLTPRHKAALARARAPLAGGVGASASPDTAVLQALVLQLVGLVQKLMEAQLAGGGTGGGVGAPSGGGGVVDPPAPRRIYPTSVVVKQWRASAPDHTPIEYREEERGGDLWLVPTTTSSFTDGVRFIPEIGYLDEKGEGIRFHDEWDTEATHHLNRTSQIFVSTPDKARVASITGSGPDGEVKVEGGGIIAAGGQIHREYARTRGMDPIVKLVPDESGGLGDGQEVIIEVYGPGANGEKVGARPVHFTVR